MQMFNEFPNGNNRNSDIMSYGEERALNLSMGCLHKLIEQQNTFREIIEQLTKLKIIHEDIMSTEIYNYIISKCESHLPKEGNSEK